MRRTVRRIVFVVLGLAVIGAIAWAFLPVPVPVDTAPVARGTMRVTVDEDGKTRIKERYTVSAPLAGRLARIRLKAGDPVEAGKTELAVIDPADPALLDPRARAQAEARVNAAQATLQQAEATRARASAAHEQAQTELARIRELEAHSAGQQLELDQAVTAERMRAAEHKAAGFACDIATFELEQARAALLHGAGEGGATDWRFVIRTPISGRVLRVLQESEAVVAPGVPLLELGDPANLEARIDVLSTEAVPIRPGAPVIFEHWGGEAPLHGIVRTVEPAAFTKISALGVEEQRVYVIVDFTDPPQARAALGDEFRVEARIVVWEQADVLKVPAGALFRTADSWCVFTVQQGRAQVRKVQVGRRNAEEAQVLSGLAEGEPVIVYPGDRVQAGVRVSPRGQ